MIKAKTQDDDDEDDAENSNSNSNKSSSAGADQRVLVGVVVGDFLTDVPEKTRRRAEGLLLPVQALEW